MIGVGSTVWHCDGNHRVYRRDASGRDASGRSTGGPIFAEYFRERVVTGETSRSWIVGDYKIPKKGSDVRMGRAPGGYSGRFYLTSESVDAAIWLDANAWRLAEHVRNCTDVEVMRAVARLVGYVEAAP